MTTGNPTLTPAAANPYVGPRRFEQAERNFFFGRDEEIKILSGLVVAHQLSLFYAQSGAGKSSLLHAGLLPRLARKTRVGSGADAYLYQTMQVLPIVTVGRGVPPRTSEPIRNIFSFSAQLTLLPSAESNDLALLTLVDALEILLEDGIPPGAIWEPKQERNGRVRPPLRKPDKTLLIFDQFEELFTVHPERWREREAFFRQVDDALVRFPTLHVLFTMREDHLAELTPYAHLLPDDLRHRFRMERLRAAGALLAVTQPALAAEPSRTFAPGVAEELVKNLQRMQRSQRSQRLAQAQALTTTDAAATTIPQDDYGEYIEPVHLQIVCRDLWASLPTDRLEIQPSDLHSFGDVDQALTKFYQSTVARVIAETQVSERTLRRWFTEELITPARTKALVYRDNELQQTARLPNAAVDILQNAWLIRSDMRGGDVWYELAHDRLVEPILAANLVWQSGYDNPVAAAYARWAAHKSPDHFLRDQALAAAEAYARQSPREVTDEEAHYLVDSRRRWDEEQAAAHNRAVRRRNLLMAGIMVMILLAGLTIYALWQADKATKAAERAEAQTNLAFTRQLLAQADQVYDENPLLGLRLVLEADAHLTQDDPKLQTQLISQTLGYLAQGKIATLATDATGFIDVPGTPWLIVKRNTANTPDELRRKADGALVPGLTGAVDQVDLVSDTFPFFVVDYVGDTPNELRRKADGTLVSTLTISVNWVNLVSDTSPFFVVYYAGVPRELRRKADGALVPGLSSLRWVNLVSDTFPFFVVAYAGDTPRELRRKADGALVPGLTGSVESVYPVSDTSPFFVVDYAGDTPGELRHKTDRALVLGLAGSVNKVIPVSDTFPFFVVDYAGDTPGELRRKADGTLVLGLTGAVEWVDLVSDTFPFFVVDYAGETPNELRRKSDGALVPGLTGSVESVYPVSDTFPFFVVAYYWDDTNELRRKADGALVPGLTGSVDEVIPVSDTFPFFIVRYMSYYQGDTKELRRKADGALVPGLTGAVDEVDLVSDTFPFFVVAYAGDTPRELRRKADGALVPGLTGAVHEVDLVSDTFPFFVVDYAGDTPDELRRKADGTLVLGLAGSVYNVIPVSDTFPFFVVDYMGGTNELRRKADGALVPVLTGSVEWVDLVSDTFPFFVVDYAGETPNELRRKSDGALVPGLTGAVRNVIPVSDTFPFFVVAYYWDDTDELRRKADGTLVSVLTGSVSNVIPVSDTFPFFVVDYMSGTDELWRKTDGTLASVLTGSVYQPMYQVDLVSDTFPFFVVHYGGGVLSEWRRKTDGELVAGLSSLVQWVNLVSDTFPFFIVHYKGGTAELWRKTDGALVLGLTGAVDEVDLVSDTFPFFVVDYAGDTPDELRRKADGALVPGLTGAVSNVIPVSDTFPFFVVDYAGDTPDELRRKADGALVRGGMGIIDVKHQAFDYFFVERSQNRHAELWQIDPPRPLVDLGIGLSWANPDSIVFNEAEQTLAIRYEDGRAYLLDLAWLAELQERTATGSIGRVERNVLVCRPFALYPFTETLQTVDYLGERPTLTCPAPLRLFEQGRHAARQLKLAEAKAFFQEAMAQDPTLAIDVEATVDQLAAQSLLRQGRWLLWQDKPAEAAAKFVEARKHEPTLAITDDLQRLVVSQLDAGQALLDANELVSATLCFDTLVALETIVGAGTLDQPTRVAIGQAYLTIGQSLAVTGNITASTAAFAQALLLDPTQQKVATSAAKTQAAQTLLARGSQLAHEQKLAEAITAFADALTLDPSLGIDAEREAQRLAAAALVEQGQTLAKWGHGPSALEWFAKAKALDPALDLDPVAEVTRLAPTPTATAPPSPLATPTPVAPSPLVTPTAAGGASPLATPTATVVAE